jgi:hypothetical protein
VSAPLLVSRSLALRDSVAAVIVRALAGGSGVEELRRYATTFSVPPDEVEAIARRLQSGLAVVEAYQREVAPTAPPLERALVQGALLFRAGLFFEVHEVLETTWHGLVDPERTFVQGLIQVAVGMHHLGHENARGAASLFASGRAKLAAHAPIFAGVEVERLLAGLSAWEESAAAGRWPTMLEPPPFVARTGDGRSVGGPS